MGQDLPAIIWWWLMTSILGWVAWPIVRHIFPRWNDRGYLLAKITGLAGTTFVVWVLGILHVAPFTQGTIWLVILALTGVSWKINGKDKTDWKLVGIEELSFGIALIFWSWIKAHEPTINGLEKFMDYGFTQSIMRTKFFPPADMWFTGESINYYYFGHLMMALLTKLSGIPLGYTFNLMLATLFAWCASLSFSIGRQLTKNVWGAILIAFLVTMSGNLQTVYAFTRGYNGEDTPPYFWTILSNTTNWKAGMQAYWYPNATRFIPWTIHEFPSYSFVVSDLHGHVLSIPLALLAFGLLVNMFWERKEKIQLWEHAIFGWACGLMFMTNALDGPIYLGLFVFILVVRNFQFSILNLKSINKFLNFKLLKPLLIALGIVVGVFVVTVLPFMLHFKPFVSGLAVNCPPASLAESKVGPLVFETVDKCQKSPVWMMLVLWGFFVYCGVWLWFREPKNIFARVTMFFCLGLIIFPEFFYFKDIYPLHFRSNTMFKLGYQAFMIMGFVSGYAITKVREKLFVLGLIPLLFLVSIYPYFSVKSYFGELKTYQGIYGLKWFEDRYPDDWRALQWLNELDGQPVILEANGDSYTDFNKLSAFSGLPTVAGWTVHEWLWRGSYDPIAKRAEEVRQIYETPETAKELIEKYKIKYIVVGDIERKKYPNLQEGGFGKKVFEFKSTAIYEVI